VAEDSARFERTIPVVVYSKDSKKSLHESLVVKRKQGTKWQKVYPSYRLFIFRDDIQADLEQITGKCRTLHWV
jgi:hypothetical protein